MGALNIDYDIINYKQASLQSSPQEFTAVNATIRKKYAQTTNLRVGVEANLKPMFVRLGYAMYGSPFGDTFSGDFVKSFFTGGVGFRREKMYEFLERLVRVALPRIRDFKGIDSKLDGRGNYTLGIQEQIIFPEINIDSINKILGMNITFVTSAKTDEEAYALLKEFGLPFKK